MYTGTLWMDRLANVVRVDIAEMLLLFWLDMPIPDTDE